MTRGSPPADRIRRLLLAGGLGAMAAGYGLLPERAAAHGIRQASFDEWIAVVEWLADFVDLLDRGDLQALRDMMTADIVCEDNDGEQVRGQDAAVGMLTIGLTQSAGQFRMHSPPLVDIVDRDASGYARRVCASCYMLNAAEKDDGNAVVTSVQARYTLERTSISEWLLHRFHLK